MIHLTSASEFAPFEIAETYWLEEENRPLIGNLFYNNFLIRISRTSQDATFAAFYCFL